MNTNWKPLVHLGLFLLTFVFTTIAGAEWIYGRWLFYGEQTLTLEEIAAGLNFSIPFLLILTVHEFGHFFTARYHQIKVTLPYYLPVWLGFLPTLSIGTLGAFIRIKETIGSRSNYFDVGVSGPLAGFVVALGVIWYGFTHLPEPEYIFQIHPEYEQYGLDYPQHVYNNDQTISIRFGSNLVFWFFEEYVLQDKSLMPHPNEIYHYPYLLAGYLALFFTAINLLPIGQLDGGHVTFGLLGAKWSKGVFRIVFLGLLFFAGMGWVNPEEISGMSSTFAMFYMLAMLYVMYICLTSMFEQRRDRLMFATILLALQFGLTYFFPLTGYKGWIVFALIIGRFLGVYHPPVADSRPLSMGRNIIGWIAIVVFIVSFSPEPFIIELPEISP
ncbi:MAG: site-2 protease family protein [Proteobacteria bacterium]|nr:site-2 protease family protein [Pseudomonadota bacterium]